MTDEIEIPAEGEPIRLERDGDVAVVILDAPPLNLFTERTFDAMRTVRDQVADSDARAMVFRAEGKVFTGGVDVGRTFADVAGSEEGKRLAQDGIRELQAFEALEIPTLALVHGLCLTAGLEAALGLRHDLGRRGRAVRPRRARRRPDAHSAAASSAWPSAPARRGPASSS